MDSKQELHYKAKEFRRVNGIGNNDPIIPKALLNKLNILTVFKPLSDDISGIAGKSKDLKFILINSNHSIGRQNFTITHELYHLFYDKNFKNTIIDYKNSSEGDEKKANTFASYLILPDGLIELLPEKERRKNKITVPSLLKVEQYYQCSRTSLLIRLENMNIVDSSYAEQFKEKIISQAMFYGYDTCLYKTGNKNVIIGDYVVKAKSLYDNDIISESNFIEYLLDIGINPEENDSSACD